MPAADLYGIQQGLFQPAADHAAAHGGVGLVQNPQQAAFLFLAAHGFGQFQIPTGVEIQFHKQSGGIHLQLPDVLEIIFLDKQQLFQQSAAGPNGGRQSCQTKLPQGHTEMGFQQFFCLLSRKFAVDAFIHAATQMLEQHLVHVSAANAVALTDNLGGSETTQFRDGGFHVSADGSKKRAGGNIAEGQTESICLSVDAGDIVVAAFLQHTAFRNGAGGDDPGDVPLYQTFGSGGVFRLLANGDLITLGHQTGDVGLHAVVGNATHGSLLLLGLVAIPAGQRQIQFPGGDPGILVKHFIEVAQTEEQQAVLMLLLDGVILPLHGCQLFFFGCHEITPFL